MRYREVFELNKGRAQPDGQELTLERLIQPQWLLVMPEDAVGVERVTAVVASAEAVAPVAPAPASAPVADAEGSWAPPSAPALETAASTEAGAVQDQVVGSVDESTAGGLIGAGLLAAGLLVALERRRRRGSRTAASEAAADVEVALRVGADPRRALLLDRGLRRLGASLRAAGRELPGVVRVRVDDGSVELLVVPPRPDAPTPWRAEDGGRTWRLARLRRRRHARRRARAVPGPGVGRT